MNFTQSEIDHARGLKTKPRAAKYTGKASKSKQRRLKLMAECWHARQYGGVQAGGHCYFMALPGIRIVSTQNTREHWAVKRERNEAQCGVISHFLRQTPPPPLPVVVKFTRIGPKLLDDDNATAAFKAARDCIAAHYGVDDKHRGRIRFEVDQRTGPYAVQIRIELMPLPADCARCATDDCPRRARCVRGQPVVAPSATTQWAAFDPNTCTEAK